VDTWVLPSHAQAARVADGSLDLVLCWVHTTDLDEHGLRARPLGAERLYAVAAGANTSPVRALDVTVLVDDDTTSWLSWNMFVGEFAHTTLRPDRAHRGRRYRRTGILRPRPCHPPSTAAAACTSPGSPPTPPTPGSPTRPATY
jgi:hypothetical protein